MSNVKGKHKIPAAKAGQFRNCIRPSEQKMDTGQSEHYLQQRNYLKHINKKK